MIFVLATTKTTMSTTKVKLTYQPTGNSCGPTCLYMAYDYICQRRYGEQELKLTIQEICEMCGTDWKVGTPPDRMEKGMTALMINYVEYIHSTRPYELLRQVLATGNLAIVRTITKGGIPHWILVHSCSPTLFNVLDPSQGELQYYQPELEELWAPRQYQFFEIIIPEQIYVHAEGGGGRYNRPY